MNTTDPFDNIRSYFDKLENYQKSLVGKEISYFKMNNKGLNIKIVAKVVGTGENFKLKVENLEWHSKSYLERNFFIDTDWINIESIIK